jgi:hypothetical protein
VKVESLAIYEKAVKLTEDSDKKGARTRRLPDLIKPPEDNETLNWHMCVPACFNNALDIKQTQRIKDGKETTVWTQGSAFSFKTGDTIYDTPKAYLEWEKALKHISICVSVEEATDAIPAKKNAEQHEMIPRYPGSVRFSILTPNEQHTAIVKRSNFLLTQDEFVLFLIKGSDGELKARGFNGNNNI